MAEWARWLWRSLEREGGWALTRLGYWIRPYDMVADRRRWRWQPRQECGYQLARRSARRATNTLPVDQVAYPDGVTAAEILDDLMASDRKAEQ